MVVCAGLNLTPLSSRLSTACRSSDSSPTRGEVRSGRSRTMSMSLAPLRGATPAMASSSIRLGGKG